ncbi:hypothetical protein DIS09_09535 [Burkholderia pseudomallei]|nr:hypothetical protein DIS09_09535 [Burkholderia pseudomallei]
MMTDRWLILDLYRQPHPQLTAYPVRVGTVSDGGAREALMSSRIGSQERFAPKKCEGKMHNAQPATHNAQRTTHNAQRTTHNAQRTTCRRPSPSPPTFAHDGLQFTARHARRTHPAAPCMQPIASRQRRRHNRRNPQ